MTDEERAERLLVQVEIIDRGASEQSLDDGTAWRLQVEHVVEFIRTIRAEAYEEIAEAMDSWAEYEPKNRSVFERGAKAIRAMLAAVAAARGKV